MTDNTDNVVPMPEPLDRIAQRILTAYERTERGREDWIEGSIELAIALAEGRARFRNDAEFGAWLGKHELDWLGKDDRAALIRMAADPDEMRAALIECKSRSWRLIATEWVRSVATPPETPKSDPVEPIESDKHQANNDTPESPGPRPVHPRNSLAGRKRAADVLAVYKSPEFPRALAPVLRQRGGDAVWQMIIAAIDSGLVQPNTFSPHVVNLRVLFPDGPRGYCQRFTLADPRQRNHVRDVIFPAMLAMRDALLADPEDMERIVTRHIEAQRLAADKAERDARAAAAADKLPAGQFKIVMFGETLWPRIDVRFGEYDHDQIRAAIWYFRDLDGWLSAGTTSNSPKSRAIMIRQSTRWFLEYIQRTRDPHHPLRSVYHLVIMLAGLLERNPRGACEPPATPHREGQW